MRSRDAQGQVRPAWPHHRRHIWTACVREWFGQPEAS